MTHRNLRWDEGVKRARSLFSLGRAEEAVAYFKEVYVDCFELDRPHVGDQLGTWHRRFIKDFKSATDKHIGKPENITADKLTAYARNALFRKTTREWEASK